VGACKDKIQPKTADGKTIKDLRAFLGVFRGKINSGDVGFGVACGPWEKVEEWGPHDWSENIADVMSFQSDKSVILTWPRDYRNGFVVTVTHGFVNEATRLVLTEKNGRHHTTGASLGGTASGMERDRYTFLNVKREDIEKFVFEKTPYQWVTFKNVSLKPNFKTDVQVESKEVGKDNKTEPPWIEYDTQEGNRASESNPQIAIDVRVFLMPQQKLLVSSFLHDELNISSVDSATPLMKPVQLAEYQARKLEEWLSLVQGVKVIAVPRFNIIDGKLGDIRLTTNHEYISSYKDPNNASDERKPVVERLTIGTIVKVTPKLQRDKETIVMNFELSDNQIVKLELMQDKAGHEFKIPIIGTQSVNTRIAVKNNRATIIPVAGGPGKTIFLLMKADVLNSLTSTEKTEVQF